MLSFTPDEWHAFLGPMTMARAYSAVCNRPGTTGEPFSLITFVPLQSKNPLRRTQGITLLAALFLRRSVMGEPSGLRNSR